MRNRNISIGFIHLGCEKNRIDTEHMMGLVKAADIEIKKDPSDADIVIVNTCSFIASAREQGVQVLCELEAANKKTIITGCMAQHFRDELLKSIPTAMALVGTGDYASIVKVIEQVAAGERVKKITNKPTFVADENLPRVRTSLSSVGWLRVAEGCDCLCAFCIIPHLRGKQRSRPMESIVAEAEKMAQEGVREIILIAQNTTNYGMDLYGEEKLPELLGKLAAVNVPWIRIHYCYPSGVTEELLQAMRANPKVLPYFDIPLQHADPDILKTMKRPFREAMTRGVLKRIREHFPEAVIRTTFIVGFPGEKPAHFKNLLDFVSEGWFDHVGVFTYSDEEGSAAHKMTGKVGKATMERRRDALMVAQQAISKRKNAECVGKTVEVLVEGVAENQEGVWVGRSARFAPEVDGVVYIKGTAKVGEIVRVQITDSDIYDQHGDVK
jgi:ribosomal protein S12 methylthiotransferase